MVTGGPESPEIVTVAFGLSLTNCLPVGVMVTVTVTASPPPVTLVTLVPSVAVVLTEVIQLADGGLTVKLMTPVPVAVSWAVKESGDVVPALSLKNSVVEHPPSIRKLPRLPVAATVKVTGTLSVLVPFDGLIWMFPL
jgi:hypothetical protein